MFSVGTIQNLYTNFETHYKIQKSNPVIKSFNMKNDSSDQDLEDQTNFRFSKRILNRSRSFNAKETRLLLDLIDTNKLYILNKSCTAAVTQAKDGAWAKIAKVLNSQQLGPTRNSEHLKSKWDRLKQSTRNISKDLLDDKNEQFRSTYNRVVKLMQIADSIGAVDDPADLLKAVSLVNGVDDPKDENSFHAGIQEKQSDDSYMDEGDCRSKYTDSLINNKFNRSSSRSLHFNPGECNLLLKCVRPEKKFIFNKECTATAIELKNRAWARVTNNYNKLSPTKRSTKALREKFKNLKTKARKLTSKSNYSNVPVNNEKDVDHHAIKVEPEHDLNPELGREASNDCIDDDPPPISPQSDHDHFSDDFAVDDDDNDPLSSVLNCDSGTDSTHAEPVNPSESKEDIKLKTELLKLQIENAKLEQKRLAQLIAEEESAKETRAIETALRLRAARLEAIAAAQKFPAGHPALLYTDLECRVQSYLGQFQHT